MIDTSKSLPLLQPAPDKNRIRQKRQKNGRPPNIQQTIKSRTTVTQAATAPVTLAATAPVTLAATAPVTLAATAPVTLAATAPVALAATTPVAQAATTPVTQAAIAPVASVMLAATAPVTQVATTATTAARVTLEKVYWRSIFGRKCVAEGSERKEPFKTSITAVETAGTKPPPKTAVSDEIFELPTKRKSTQSAFNTAEELVQLTDIRECWENSYDHLRANKVDVYGTTHSYPSLDDMDESERVCVLKCIRSRVHGHAEEIAKEFLQLDDVFEEVRKGGGGGAAGLMEFLKTAAEKTNPEGDS